MSFEGIDIGPIGGHHGFLMVVEKDGKYYWGIDPWDGHEKEEISKSLYDELIKHKENLQKQHN